MKVRLSGFERLSNSVEDLRLTDKYTYEAARDLLGEHGRARDMCLRLHRALAREAMEMSGDRSLCRICHTTTTGPHVAEKFTHPHAATCPLWELP